MPRVRARRGAFPHSQELLGAHLLLMNLCRWQTEARRKGLAGPTVSGRTASRGGGPRLKQVCHWSYCAPRQPGFSDGPLHTGPGDLVTK